MQLGWIRYGWGALFQDQIVPGQPLYIDVRNQGYISRVDPLTAALDAITKITETYPEPYTLMLSGGVDSQAMLWAWLKSKVPFQSVTFTYNSIYNHHDIKTTIKVAQEFGYRFNYCDFDMLGFLEGPWAEQYARPYQCSSPQICAYMRLSETVSKGTVIFSGNFLMGDHDILLNYTLFGLDRYSVQNQNRVIPFFFMHTPELAHAFRPFLAERNLSNSRHDLAKIDLNHAAGFPVIAQGDRRFSGFELIKDLYDRQHHHRVPAANRLKYAAKYLSTRTFDLLLRYPLLEEMQYSEATELLIL